MTPLTTRILVIIGIMALVSAIIMCYMAYKFYPTPYETYIGEVKK